jgi:Flp pilus assembly protein TadG
MIRPCKKHCIGVEQRRGAAAVEFALVAPVFLLLLAGIIEFGQAFRAEHMLSIASRRGARSGVVSGSNTSEVRQMVITQVVNTLGVQPADVNVLVMVNGNAGIDLSDAERGSEVSVTVSVPFNKAGIGFYSNLLSNAALSSTTQFERE